MAQLGLVTLLPAFVRCKVHTHRPLPAVRPLHIPAQRTGSAWHCRRSGTALHHGLSLSSSCRNSICLAAQGKEAGAAPATDEARRSEPVVMYDEPEAAVLLVACAIGLATGAGVVVFNDIIKLVHEVIWTATLPEATAWDHWARDLPFQDRWAPLLLPPSLGGLAVGLLRKASGGFEEQQQQKQQLPEPQQDKAGQVKAGVTAGRRTAQRETGSTPHAVAAASQEAAVASSRQGQQSESGVALSSITGNANGGGEGRASSGEGRGSSGDGRASGGDGRASGGEGGASGGEGRASSGEIASTSGRDVAGDSSTVWSFSWLAESSQECKESALRLLRPLLKATAAAITLGTGNSLGPEGPSVEIGRAAARGLGNVLKSKQRRLLSLIAAGSGAGVAAGFNAPISGVFFAVETVLQSETNNLPRKDADTTPGLTIAMVLLASVLAAIVSQAGLGQAPAVRVPDYQLQSLYELPLILGFGACCGAVSASFAYSNQVAAGLFKQAGQKGLDPALMPAVGGLITGLVALQYPEVLYQGFGNVNAILQNRDHFSPLLLFQILAVKVLCTSVSKGSGLVGGTYAPSIFMGATLGSAFGGTAALLLRPLGLAVAAPQAYALVGVAAMLAANCQVPLTAVLLLFELTQDYFIILPTLGAVGISYWVASLPTANSAFVPSQFQDSDQSSNGGVEGSGYMDALHLTSQLGLDVAGEVDINDEDENAGQLVSGETQLSSIGTNGSRKGVAMDPSYRAVAGNGPSDKVLQSLDTSPEAVDGASVACALEEACVLLTVDTSMAEALEVMDEVGQKVALVTNAEGAVVGVLTRESIVRELSKGPNASLKTIKN